VLAGQLLRLHARSSNGGASASNPQSNRGMDWALMCAAAFAALLFGVHPMRVESAVWITERRDVLTALFAITCTSAYLQYTPSSGRSRAWWYAASLVLFALALLSKAITVTLPAVLIALDWHPLRRDIWRDRRVWNEKIPFIVLSALFAVIILNVQEK